MTSKSKYESKYGSFKSLNCYEPEIEFFGYQFDFLKSIENEYDFNQLTCFDIGCGFGIKTYYLAENFKQVVGGDFVENIINVNNLLNDKENLNFIPYDFNLKTTLSEKFDCITAFGFSMLNIKDNLAYINNVNSLFELLKSNGLLIVWSFTDFSGTAPSGWYNHTKKELDEIVSVLQGSFKKVNLIYPHGRIYFRDLFSIKGLKRVLRYFIKKKYYFLIINK